MPGPRGRWRLRKRREHHGGPPQIGGWACGRAAALQGVQAQRRTEGPAASHALRCAPGPSTKGHNDVRNAVLDFKRLADATSEPEVLGLIASAPGARPSDVFTSALTVDWDTVLDVGIPSPEAAHAGPDCTESMRKRRVEKYAPFSADFATAHVVYWPLIWSCFGREHPDTVAALHSLARRIARRIARRRGFADHLPVLTRIRAAIGVALARRGAGISSMRASATLGPGPGRCGGELLEPAGRQTRASRAVSRAPRAVRIRWV